MEIGYQHDFAEPVGGAPLLNHAKIATQVGTERKTVRGENSGRWDILHEWGEGVVRRKIFGGLDGINTTGGPLPNELTPLWLTRISRTRTSAAKSTDSENKVIQAVSSKK